MRKFFTIAALVLMGSGIATNFTKAQNRPPDSAKPPMPAKQAALIDLTGYWVSIVDEDWRWRMVTPSKGDYASIPLNGDGRKAADTWDLAKDEADGNQCRAYGAAGLMRVPTRLHVTWADDNTLQVDTDAGTQTRLFHFDGSKWNGGEPGWQGDSVAKWERQVQQRGFAPKFGGPVPGQGGTLHVVTTHMRPGYYRKNGVPYSGDATLIEYFDRVEANNQSYLILTTVVQDPKYLNDQFITSEQFAREPDGSKWHPTPCMTDKPAR
jgi:hypothetical protein